MKQLLILLTLLIAFGSNALAQKKVSNKKLTKTIKGDWDVQSPKGEPTRTQVLTFKPNGELSMDTEKGTETGKWKVLDDGQVLFHDSSRGIPDQEMGVKIVNKNTLVMTIKKGDRERSITITRKKKSKKGK
ncbi:MAG: hypothetical protein GY810_30720 [Aureispira sp.]|nr:hypothetical protein [Aureispira sp.]